MKPNKFPRTYQASQVEMAGFYRARAVSLDGSQRLLADWFPNLITNGGLNHVGFYLASNTYCLAGTGSAAPSAGDSSLGGFVAATGTVIASSRAIQSSAPYYGSSFKTYRFPIGVAAGNISELGIGWANSNSSLFSRALIVDGGGSPLTITVLSTEILEVDYEFRLYPPTLDSSATLNIAGIDYSFVGRPALVTGVDDWGVETQLFIGSGALLRTSFGVPLAFAYNGTIGAVTSTPSGSSGQASSHTTHAYSNNSLVQRFTITFDPTHGNVAGGISALMFRSSLGDYQVGITPSIPKDATKQFTYTFDMSWARKTIP